MKEKELEEKIVEFLISGITWPSEYNRLIALVSEELGISKEKTEKMIGKIREKAKIYSAIDRDMKFFFKEETEQKNLTETKDKPEEMGDYKFIGDYELIESISNSLFGWVYKAKRDGKFFALKVGYESAGYRKEDFEKFEETVKIWKSISDIKGVVKIYDAGTTPAPWLAMELCEPLEKPIFLKRIISVVIDILETLEEVHKRGVVHRDLKPTNILMCGKRVKIGDWSRARMGVISAPEKYFEGTIAYAAPEQFIGEWDHRTDIYQVGAILYEMLSGHLPFEGDSEWDISYAILNTAPKPIEGIEEELNNIVFKALEKRKEDRWQSAEEFKRALEGEVMKGYTPKGGI